MIRGSLDLGTETHHDLGPEFNPFTESESPYSAFYSQDGREVMFWPPQQRDSVLGDYWFYAIAGGVPRVVRAVSSRAGAPRRAGEAAAADPRVVRIERIAGRSEDRLYFDSSEIVYHIADASDYKPGNINGPFEVAKYTYGGYGTEEGPQRTEVWRRTVPMNIALASRAHDGPWLALGDGGRRVLALDTSTGRYALAFPTISDPSSQIAEHLRYRETSVGGMNNVQRAWASAALTRLRDVLGPESTVEDVGNLGGFWFEAGNRLVLSRSLGRYPDFRRFHDVFDMETVAVDGGPAFRLEKDDVACGLGGLSGLDVRERRLVYPGPRAVPTSDRPWTEANPIVDERETP